MTQGEVQNRIKEFYAQEIRQALEALDITSLSFIYNFIRRMRR